jgi:hypothetical protein
MSYPNTHYQSGHLATDWVTQPVTVHGGYRLMRTRWVRTRQGWDEEQEPTDDATVYPTHGEAVAARQGGGL